VANGQLTCAGIHPSIFSLPHLRHHLPPPSGLRSPPPTEWW
jgi:hypothetical protein